MDDLKLSRNRLFDLEAKAEKTGSEMFSKFLSPAEYKALPSNFSGELFGGYEDAIYKVAAFNLYGGWQISAVKITPYEKGRLNHRDYLGSVLGLGLERNVVGDVLVNDEFAVIYCLRNIAEFIIQNLKYVGRVSVTAEEIDLNEAEANVRFKEIFDFVPSLRLDNILSAAIGTSRTRAAEILKSGAVKLNYIEETRVDKKVSEKDIITVRGIGKFIFDGVCGTSKKDRLKITLRKYV